MNIVFRVGKCLAGCLLLAGPPLFAQTPVVTPTNVTVRLMAANLTSGNGQSYEAAGLNIFKGLKPDVVAIQEFKYSNSTPADFRTMLDTTFGTNFVYYRESGYSIPNGVISRFPILAAGSWDDPMVGDRGFAWAQLDVPGTNDLYVVSVHLYSSGSATDRNTEALAIKSNIAANFPANAWVVVGGDFNTDTRSEAAVTTFKTFLSDSPIPSDQAGNQNTSAPRSKPYDYLLPSFSFTNGQVAVAISNQSSPNGLVFDSRVYLPIASVAPVQVGDSGAANMQHMGVIKDFNLTYTVTNSPADVPAITTQPQSQTVEPGSNATFAVVATGAPTLQYQWRLGGTILSGATVSTLTVTNAQGEDAGSYAVVITNLAGSITSSPATLIVASAPLLTAQPQNQSVNAGATVGFSVTASGTGPLAYQWRLNGTNLSGATASSCALTNVQSKDEGSYSVIVTNVAGSAASSNATLAVYAPPAITAQPQSQMVSSGQDALFTVTASGTAPLSYQWRFNTTNLAGATTSSYTRTNAQPGDAGSYSVVITNGAGSITSTDAVLTVATTPSVVIAQWDFNSPTPDANTATGTLVPSTGSGTASLVGGTSQTFAGGGPTDPNTNDNSGWNSATYPALTAGNKTAGVKFAVSTAGKQNITIRWDQRESTTGSKYVRLRYTTNGTDFIDFPTAVSVSSSSWELKTNNLSAFAGVNNNSNFAFQIVAEFESTATGSGNSNYVGAAGNYGTAGTVRFDMVTLFGMAIPVATPPSITSQPANQAATQGAAASFRVLATGTVPLTYQWRLNASSIAGATASSYARSNVQPADMGSYSVVVSNTAGGTLSSNAALSLVVPAPTLLLPSPGILQWQGLSNLSYTVQVRTNLEQSNWFTLGAASAPGAIVSFTNQPDAPRRFYRVVYP
jgi:endonuclease/exonuclease/phosphatase family metal-dependent hydrolase